MSKSLNTIYIPAIGGAALVIGLAYGLANRDYAKDKIQRLEDRVAQVETHATTHAETATGLRAQLAQVEAEAAEAVALAMSASLTEPAPKPEGTYGLGRQALPEEIAAWDVDIRPDGTGLPPGRGDVWTGDEVFADYCAACHGDFAEGVDNWPVLAGGFDTLADKDPVKTVGSYWPYLSTVWDYVHRSMPFGGAQTLTDDEVYAIVAYILYSNDLVDDDFELSHENFAEVAMYNTDGFIVDDRAETEYPIWSGEPCMENCKDRVEITMRASILDVTPADGEDQAAAGHSMSDQQEEVVIMASTTAQDAAAPMAAALDPALVASGEKVFRKCASCHMVGDGAKNRSGPHLTGIMGRTQGSIDGFSYSGGFQTAANEGRVWDEEAMAAFLTKPKSYMAGTKMSFAGLRNEKDIDAIIAYLRSFDG
ncbi:MAG: c-type cytochrome [Pseudomonadota bacterium]